MKQADRTKFRACTLPVLALLTLATTLPTIASHGSDRDRRVDILRFDLPQSGYIRTWLVCGPFPNLPKRGLLGRLDERPGFRTDWLKPIGGESGAQPREGLPVRLEGLPPCIWKLAQARRNGYVDLRPLFFPNMHVVAYAACLLDCREPTVAVLRVGSDDGIKVWLNGKRVHQSWRARGWRADEDRVPVRLHRGPNRLLIKVDQLIAGWGFSVRIADERGKRPRAMEIQLPCDLRELDVLRMLARAAQAEPEKPALTAGDGLAVRVRIGPLGPKTTATIVARARVEGRPGKALFELGEMLMDGQERRAVLFRADRLAALDDGTYQVKVNLATTDGRPLATKTCRFFYVRSYARRLKEAKEALREAAATLKDRRGVLATITLPSLDRLILDAQRRWSQFEEFERDMAYIRKQLFDAEAGALAMRTGRDWYATQTGHLVKAYRCEHDGTLQPYSVYVPRDYDPSRPWPLVIGLHGAWSNHWLHMRRLFGKGNRPGETDAQAKKVMPPLDDVPMLVACPNGRETSWYRGPAEKDVWRVLDDMKRAYNVDESRIYLTGLSMGGEATWRLGLLNPHIFAAIAPVCGPTDYRLRRGADERPRPFERTLLEVQSAINYAENALNLPIHIFHGTADPVVPVANSDAIFERLRQLNYPVAYTRYSSVGHNSWDAAYHRAGIFDWFAQYRLNRYPRRVIYKAVVTKPRGAYWVRIDRPIRLRRFSTIEAEITGNWVEVRVENVARFSLFLNRHLLDTTRPVEITVNGRRIPRVWVEEPRPVMFELVGDEFRRTFKPYRAPLLPGFGMEEIADWHIYVYGTSGAIHETIRNFKAAERAADWGRWRDVKWPIKRDDEITSKDLRTANLVLIGTPWNNRLLSRIADQLPIKIERDAIRLGWRRYRGRSAGLAMIYRNPLAPDRYVFIRAAFTAEGYENMEHNMPRPAPDYVIFDRKGRIARAGFFDASWRIEQ